MRLINNSVLVTVLVALILTSCNAGASSVSDNQPLKIAYTDWPGDYIVLIAQELGYFDKYGVEVTPVHYASFSRAIPDMGAGRIDGINIVPIDLLPIIQNNNIRIVMVTDSSNGADQIVASSDISTVADLKGKRIGVNIGTFGEFLVRQMLENNGLTVADVTLVDVSPEKVPDSIPSLIDAGHTWEPYTSRAKSLGQHILFTSAETPGLLPDVFAFRATIAQERPEDVRNFVAAWLEAARWWNENQEEGIQIVASIVGIDASDITLDGIKLYTSSDNQVAFSKNPGVDPSSIYYVIRQNLLFSIETGYITVAPEIGTIVDPSFLP